AEAPEPEEEEAESEEEEEKEETEEKEDKAKEKAGKKKEAEAEKKEGAEEEEEEPEEEEEKEKEKPAAKKKEPEKKKPAPKKKEEEKEEEKKLAPAAPSVRRLARELGADINLIPGSGPGGRISLEDVKRYVRHVIEGGRASLPEAAEGIKEMPDFSRWGDITRKPLSKVRSIIAGGTAQSWSLIPHVTQFDKADITELEKFRKKYTKAVEKEGGKLTVTAILLKVIVAALKKYPRFNASIDPQKGEVIYKEYYNIGMAVDTDRGLLVPVIPDVDKKSIFDLSVELLELADRTRDKKVKPDELEGGTFTISNQGGIGGTDFTPIVFWPQVAILGVSRASRQPVFDEDEGTFKPRIILPLSLSYDHRIIDGADAARFLKWVTEALEHPLLLDFE
ncbi:MAG: branched-chain alpha-keto acid dehydrogenase subunit E2, partial [candidate division Zixibacteria bacterium]|nr:branched-chain alpha-keto acid dehydrogenase subunit E2 [candidate division Zixibacteria bacterium]NIR67591.1 branched-chain alpha-keto acid dehydrogenase subunit E2 [candidate division Zixibacteria bacterium]NIS16322.1 branched-chain alpha-keto acid dehydrogenase subunit E2 [candidate division Zixibacteria bacterium]NIS48852.1 branched-chain alpha-keto acid dehydrogenase subunit E2 [candidate division Zixibacteria bacterium]NIT52700.1 branched-chain alpha-keto acid dehydrogenase subunit E2 